MKLPKKIYRGYTLIELIVALGVFAIIMTLAAGAYFVVLGIDREARATSTAVDNLSFALESMTRTIRTGTNYSQSSADCSGTSCITLETAGGETVTYALGATGEITKKEATASSASPITGSSAAIDISALTFTITGAGAGDHTQPRVAIVIRGYITASQGQTPMSFIIQTLATMRGIDPD